MREIKFSELRDLQSENKKILVDFKAKWCQPCRILIPRLENIEKEYQNIEFVMVDVDDNQENVMELGIRGVPTVMIFDGNNLVNRSSGVQSDNYYKDILKNL